MTTWRPLKMCRGDSNRDSPRDVLENPSAFKTYLVPQTVLSVSVIPPGPDSETEAFLFFDSGRNTFLLRL